MQMQGIAVKGLRLHKPFTEDMLMKLYIHVLEGMGKREAALDLLLQRSPVQFEKP